MATINEVLGGLQILAKYKGDKHEVNAEHDIIYACSIDSTPLTDEETRRLVELGWHVDSEYNCWACFV